jgi:hypothetical protein
MSTASAKGMRFPFKKRVKWQEVAETHCPDGSFAWLAGHKRDQAPSPFLSHAQAKVAEGASCKKYM